MMLVNSSMSFCASWVSWTPVRTCVFCGQDRLDLLDELLGRDAFVRRDRDGVELSFLVEQPLGLGEREDGERGAAERFLTGELRRSGDRELLHRPLADDADRVADRVSLFLRGGGVDHDLAVGVGPGPGRELVGMNGSSGSTPKASVGGPPPPTMSPSLSVSWAESSMLPAAMATPGRSRTWPSRLVEDGGGITPSSSLAEGRLAGDHGVGVRVDRREDVVESLVDRVGEDVGAADHRDAEDDRERGQRRAELAAGEAP